VCDCIGAGSQRAVCETHRDPNGVAVRRRGRRHQLNLDSDFIRRKAILRQGVSKRAHRARTHRHEQKLTRGTAGVAASVLTFAIGHYVVVWSRTAQGLALNRLNDDQSNVLMLRQRACQPRISLHIRNTLSSAKTCANRRLSRNDDNLPRTEQLRKAGSEQNPAAFVCTGTNIRFASLAFLTDSMRADRVGRRLRLTTKATTRTKNSAAKTRRTRTRNTPR
jgi:hypothetical protein